MGQSHSMGARAARALIWQYGSTFGGRILSLVAVALLARLLTPADFGLLGFALIVTGFLDVVRDFGLSQGLVISKDPDEDAVANTVFRWGLLISSGLWIVAIAIGPLAAGYFDEPRVAPIMAVLGSTFLIRALSLTHYALAQKRLEFRSRTIAELVNTGGRGLAGVVMALIGFGVWALVLSYVVGAILFTITLWLTVGWRPRWGGATVPVRGLLVFGGTLTLVDIAAAVLYSVDGIVIGRMIGQDALGLYSIGLRLPELIVLNLSVSLGVVLFPAFAGVPREQLGDAFLKALRFTLMLALPLGVGLVVMAEPVTLALFGDKWLGSVGAMQVLCAYAFFYAMGIPAGTVYKAIGRANLLLKLAIPQVVLVIAFSIPMAQYGIEAVASVVAGVTALFFVVGLIIVPHMIPVRYVDLWRATRANLFAGLVTAVVLLAIQLPLDMPWVEVLLAIVLGGAAYFGTMWLVARDQLQYVASKVAPGRFGAPDDEPAEVPVSS
ncbi:MAG: lipopolysaccharide biosynthesis protein [Thermoleophilia bacterium]